jgi:hypothetical protein
LVAVVMKQPWDTYEDVAETFDQQASSAQWMALAVFESGELCLLQLSTGLAQIHQIQQWPEKLEGDWHNCPRFDHHPRQKEHPPACHQYSESDHQNRPVGPVPPVQQVPSDSLILVRDIPYTGPAVHGRLPAHTRQWKVALQEVGFVELRAPVSPSVSKLISLPDPMLHQIESPFQQTESHRQTARALLTDCLESHASW